MKLIFCRHY